MGELVRLGDGDIVLSEAGKHAVTKWRSLNLLSRLVSLLHQARSKGGVGSYLLCLPASMRDELGASGRNLIDAGAFEYGAGDQISVAGIIGICFTEGLGHREMSLVDVSKPVARDYSPY